MCLLASTALLGGCGKLLTCQGPSDIGDGGKSIASLRVPAGLTEINTKDALRIPELNEPEPPQDKNKCLDAPPSYFPDRRPGAEAPAETRPVTPPAPQSEAQPQKEQPGDTPPKP